MKAQMDLTRPLSWSAMSSFEYDPEQWYEKYVIHGKCTRENKEEGVAAYCVIMEGFWARCPQIETSAEMEFGKLVGERLASDPSYLPHVPRLSTFEYKLECKFGKIKLVGYMDSYEPHTNMEEYKTGKKAWDQKRADEHGQLSFYLLCLNIMHRVKPEDIECCIRWLPTQQNGDFSISLIKETDMRSFPTKRTMRQLLEFGQRINRNYAAMQAYAKNHV